MEFYLIKIVGRDEGLYPTIEMAGISPYPLLKVPYPLLI